MNLIGLAYLILSIYAFSRRSFFKYLLVITMVINVISQAYGLQIVALAVGGITLYISDMPVVLMFIYIILNPILPKTKYTFLWFVLFCMVVLSAFRGYLNYGINLYYLSDVRVFLSIAIPIIYFYSQQDIFDQKFIRFFDCVMTLLVTYCYIAWIMYSLFGISFSMSDTGGGLRVIGSNGTMYIALYTLVQIYIHFFVDNNRYGFIRIIYNIIAVVILQHNSVWAAFATGYLVMLVLIKRYDRNSIIGKIQLWKITLLLGVIAIVVLIVFSNIEIVTNLLETFSKYSQFGTGEGTIGDRQRIWEGYLSSLSGSDWLMGKPMGTGWFVESIHGASQVPAHNGYVQGIMRIGLIGDIALFGMLGIMIISSLYHYRHEIIIVIIPCLVYMYAYMFSLELSCVWGILLGYMIGNVRFEEGNNTDEYR